jgi:hypothetical protein
MATPAPPASSPPLGGYVPPAAYPGPGRPAPAAPDLAGEAAPAAAVPWPLAATVFAATSIIVGLIWDISWHLSIGRDTFWTPAHLGIYLGGTTAGLANGFLVLKTTFAGTAAERARSVRFWGFRGPLGAFVSIWGAGAMLTSAPFDDWWHGAYGLDVEILSPPHTVLLLGIFFVLGGACVTALQAQNAAEAAADPRAGRFRRVFAYTLGLLLTMGALAVWSDTRPPSAHQPHFYQYAAVPLAFVLAAAARALGGRWPATTVALVYMGLFLAMGWLLQPWPATPKLGPIRQDITHMQSLGFPLFLAAPALAIDVVARRARAWRPALQALAVGFAFLAGMVAVEWWFSAFLLSPAARNPVFLGGHFPYSLPKTSAWSRGEYWPSDLTPAQFWRGMGWAALAAVLSARLGLAWGGWMREVRR